MNQQNISLQKLSRYGIDATQLTQRALQQKIIQMYDFLELKTTQNLLLRKQNDDIKLQISTIEEVFTNAQKNINSAPEQTLEKNHSEKNSFFNRQIKSNFCQSFKNPLIDQQSILEPSLYEKKLNSQQNNHVYLQRCEQSEHIDLQHEQKTPRCSSKPHRNSRFCQDDKVTDKQTTSRMFKGNKVECSKEESLNQKIQLLMKQNQIILKRMNQIEVTFISNCQRQQQKIKFDKNNDDQSTNFSSNITSIQNIWTKKETYGHNRGLSSNDGRNYSSNNLRSYCPSVN